MGGLWIEIGRQLKQARFAAGLSLDDLQERTQVSQEDLAALEEGDFHRLPSPFYVRSYLRTYASQVGLEPTQLLRKYRATEQTLSSSPSSGRWQAVGKNPSAPGKAGSANPRTVDRQGATGSRWNTDPHRRINETGLRAQATEEGEQRKHPLPSPSPLGNYDWKDFLEPPGTSTIRSQAPLPSPSIQDPMNEAELHSRIDQVPSAMASTHTRSRTQSQSKQPNPLFHWPIWITILGMVLIIPAGLWAAIALPATDGEQTDNSSGSPGSQGLTENARASIPEGMALISREDRKSVYELQNNQDLVLEIKPRGKCWVQVKEHEGGGYLKDITLDKGDPPFRFTHAKSVTTDLWILLGSPKNADIQINGQPFNPSDVIHIKKVQ